MVGKITAAEINKAQCAQIQGVVNQGLEVIRRFCNITVLPTVNTRMELIDDGGKTQVVMGYGIADSGLGNLSLAIPNEPYAEINIGIMGKRNEQGQVEINVRNSARFNRQGNLRNDGHIQTAFKGGGNFQQDVIDWCNTMLSAPGTWIKVG